jgi:hypothetical protein
MLDRTIAPLAGILRPELALSKSRVETLCMIVIGMVSARTVNLSHLACEGPGAAQPASTYRRRQRVFQHVRLEQDWALPLLVRLLGSSGSWHLALDRTQWQVGRTEVNSLGLAVVPRRFRVPLIWNLIEGRGGSETNARMALIQRDLDHVPATTIRMRLADREFTGPAWRKVLHDNTIPFAVRLKESLRVTTEDGPDLTLRARLYRARRSRTFRARIGASENVAASDAPLLDFAAKRLGDEWLIIATNVAPRAALEAYRKRWAIECRFGDTKTRGLNLEDTRLREPRKLSLLMALVALAIAWAGRTAADRLGRRNPPRKAHGYYAKSWFRIGFDHIQHRLRTDPLDAIGPWFRIVTQPEKMAGVV